MTSSLSGSLAPFTIPKPACCYTFMLYVIILCMYYTLKKMC